MPEESTLESFAALLSSIFTERETTIVSHMGDDGVLVVSWPTPDLPGRPNKRSRPIHVVFSKEVLGDYESLGPISQKRFDERLVDFVRSKYGEFNPSHDTPRNQVPEAERWVVPSYLFQ